MGVIAITTNGTVTGDGRAVLGSGCARQAVAYFPDLARQLGELVSTNGNHVQVIDDGLVSFPVEETPWSLPDPALIARSAVELRELADRRQWQLVVVPRPGCGGGGMAWQDICVLIEPFFDDRFVVITC